MSSLEVHQFICRSDSYGVLLHAAASGETAAIDAPEAAAIERELERNGWALSHILTTHHHFDHVDGNLPLKEKYDCRILGPAAEMDRIPGIDLSFAGGGRFQFAGRDVQVFDCPGHTKGHIAFHMPGERLLFAGDTLFAMGCGRVLPGLLGDMWRSLDQFRALPRDTQVYCGHEYTEANARFALASEPGNAKLQARALLVKQQRAAGQMTCPTTIGGELDTNPFLRPDSAEIRNRLGLETASDADVFAELRRRKDNFK